MAGLRKKKFGKKLTVMHKLMPESVGLARIPEVTASPKERKATDGLADIPKVILKKLEIHPVSNVDEVLKLALTRMPEPLAVVPPSEKAKPAKDGDLVTTH